MGGQRLKVIWYKAASHRRRMVQSYSPCGANVPSWNHLPNRLNLCFLRPTRVYNPSSRQSVVRQIGATWRVWLNFCFVPAESTTQVASGSVQPCLHRWLQSVPILFNGTPLLVKIAPSHGVSGLPGPTQVFNPNGISIGSAIFAGLTSVTDRPTDHTKVGKNRPHLRT